MAGFVRPNELLIVVAAIVVAIMIMPSSPVQKFGYLGGSVIRLSLGRPGDRRLPNLPLSPRLRIVCLSLNKISQNNAGTTSATAATSRIRPARLTFHGNLHGAIRSSAE